MSSNPLRRLLVVVGALLLQPRVLYFACLFSHTTSVLYSPFKHDANAYTGDYEEVGSFTSTSARTARKAGGSLSLIVLFLLSRAYVAHNHLLAQFTSLEAVCPGSPTQTWKIGVGAALGEAGINLFSASGKKRNEFLFVHPSKNCTILIKNKMKTRCIGRRLFSYL